MQLNKLFRKEHNWWKVLLFALYAIIILAITVAFRERGFFYTIEYIPFWSYVEWFKGNFNIGLEIILNIGFFIPFGFLASSLFETKKRHPLLVILCGFSLSVLIEAVQYKYKLGLAEFDDVFNNTLGTAIGVFLFEFCIKRIKNKYILGTITFLFVITGLIFSVREALLPQVSSVIEFAFQIDFIEDGQLSGYAFPYGTDAGTFDYSIILKNTETGEQDTLPTQTNIDCQKVNQYFNCEYDYSKSGFIATYDYIPESAEVLIDWKGVGVKKTGVYIVNGKVQCTAEFITFYYGSEVQNLIDSGTLMVHNAKYGCDVYQVGEKLYWIASTDFHFEDDNSTYIQYQLWTSNIDFLPENRQQYEFDNIGFIFEEHEITDKMNCGQFRIAEYDIPDKYPVTYILTGYYNGCWLWKNYFRPINRMK